MAKDVIARMRVETQQWEQGMGRARKSMDEMQKSTGGMDKALGSGIASMAKFATAAASIKVAMDGANKLIGSSQTLTDAFGRTMQATTRVVDSFFESLARGSFQSFLGGLDGIISKAREAYDALDTLGTFDIFATPLRARNEAMQAELKYNIRAGIGNIEEQKAALKELEKELAGLSKQESALADTAASKLLASFANAQGGSDVLDKLFMTGGGAQDKAGEMAEELRRKYAKTVTLKANIVHPQFGTVVGERTTSRLEWADEEQKKLYEALMNFNEMDDTKLQEVAQLRARAWQAQTQAYNKMRENLETLNMKPKGGGAGGAGGAQAPTFDTAQISAPSMSMTTSMEQLEAMQRQWKEKLAQATDSATAEMADRMLADIQARMDAQPIALRLGMDEESIARINEQMMMLGESMRNEIQPLELIPGGSKATKPLDETNDKIQAMAKNLGKTSTAFGTMGAAMQQLDDPAAQVAGLILQACANVASSFAAALANEKNVWSWIAAGIAGTATMISTIAAIKSINANSYADGGTVTGGAFTGDAVPIMANAGEIVLNASQQQALASQLEPREGGTQGSPYVSGEQIYLGLNNYLRRSGRGEMTTSRTSKQ
ncbi:MAG: hypothetical protein NC319_09360 [Butyricicoccus sp.]|nr:hypothetical protein [Butyricicoccus sp.]MCM1372946.1 hypothetical protein [Bacteroides sp.]MCM1448290.1 hypothetical protein [Bacteroides sp.]